MDPYERDLMNIAAAIWALLKHIAQDLDAWNAAPVRGTIYINGVAPMTTGGVPTPIPSEDCPAVVVWQDRFGTAIPHDATTTTWGAVDENGAPSPAVTVTQDDPSNDENAMVHFVTSAGQFMVTATTTGGDGNPVNASSALYDIQPGAPTVGTITVTPAAGP